MQRGNYQTRGKERGKRPYRSDDSNRPYDPYLDEYPLEEGYRYDTDRQGGWWVSPPPRGAKPQRGRGYTPRGAAQGRGRGRTMSTPTITPAGSSSSQAVGTLPDPAALFSSFAAKAQASLLPLISQAYGMTATARPCFKYHLERVLDLKPQLIGQLLQNRIRPIPSEQYRVHYADAALGGCTDPSCPYVHDLGTNFSMPACTNNAGQHCTSANCSRAEA